MRTLLLLFTLLLSVSSHAQTPDHVLKRYKMVWNDEFEGDEIDFEKWSYRATGDRRQHGVVHEENSFVDGKGHLVIQVTEGDSLHQIGQIGTQNTYLTRYGYFECRAKMNKELGPHMAFWIQSPYVQEERFDPKNYGTEIDIFEYHVNEGKEWVYHNLHWNGYGKNHKSTGTKLKIDQLDEGWHTFGLEWTKDEYIFYVDGVETWRTTEAVSNIEEYMILSAELSGWGGDFSKSKFPDSVMFDYVRVYKKQMN